MEEQSSGVCMMLMMLIYLIPEENKHIWKGNVGTVSGMKQFLLSSSSSFIASPDTLTTTFHAPTIFLNTRNHWEQHQQKDEIS